MYEISEILTCELNKHITVNITDNFRIARHNINTSSILIKVFKNFTSITLI